MKIACLSSEVDPFAKTGGLADVAGSLPKALGALDHDVRILLPLYRQVDRQRFNLRPTETVVSVSAGVRPHQVRFWEATMPGARVPVLFAENEALFGRDGLYGQQGADFPDNLERFSVFSQVALDALRTLGWAPEVVHAHDWQSALAVAHLAVGPRGRDPFWSSTATIFTVHNQAYQGVFPGDQWPLTGLPDAAFSIQGLEFYGKLNCLKGGLVSAGFVTTVSPTYAREIQTPEFGCGLEGVLVERRETVTGIINGIDVDVWNPETDPHIAAHFSAADPSGKTACKQALQQSQGLTPGPDLLIGMIQRLAEQKGIDIFAQACEALMRLPIQLVILGTGELKYHDLLTQFAKRFPGRVALNLKFDNALAHQIEAGADAFLMPSRFEPCGLNQMYSMRYGTIPIVRRVGGLADTVVDTTPASLTAQTATGFVFEAYTAEALVAAVKRAVAAFGDRRTWPQLIRHAMRQDFSWTRSARDYVSVYERALAAKRPRTRAAASASPR